MPWASGAARQWSRRSPTPRLNSGFARFFLGVGKYGNFPAAIKTIAEWFPQSERSLATGIFNSGANVGAILASLMWCPRKRISFGWRAAFLTTGIFSALWILWWWKNCPQANRSPYAYPQPGLHRLVYKEAATQMGPGTLNISCSGKGAWAFSVAKNVTDAVWWFYLFWLPSYFSSKFHLNL